SCADRSRVALVVESTGGSFCFSAHSPTRLACGLEDWVGHRLKRSSPALPGLLACVSPVSLRTGASCIDPPSSFSYYRLFDCVLCFFCLLFVSVYCKVLECFIPLSYLLINI